MAAHDIVVIGASAGGIDATRALLSTLPPVECAILTHDLVFQLEYAASAHRVLDRGEHSGPLVQRNILF